MTTVSCPNCEASYHVDPARLGDGDRKLKCAKCQTVWIARSPRVESAWDAPVEPEIKAETQEQRVVSETWGERELPEIGQDSDASYAPLNDDILLQRSPGVDAVVHVGGWQRMIRGDNLWRTIAVAFVAIGLLTGAVVILNKLQTDESVEASAPRANFEEPVAAGVDDVVEPPKGVVLHRVRGEVTQVDGGSAGMALTVRGLLLNTTDEAITVPPMRLELLGADGAVIDMWPVSGIAARMEGGAEEAWTVSLTAPDMSIVSGWRVVFVAE
jgi:predicted Zn finger-like uncharacterized protein